MVTPLETGVTNKTEAFLLRGLTATSMMVQTVATALGPSVTEYMRLDNPTNIAAYHYS